MPTLTALPGRKPSFNVPLNGNWRIYSSFKGSAGQVFYDFAEKVLEGWIDSCKQVYVLREVSQDLSYHSLPPKRSSMASVRYHLRGRGEPLSYPLDDE
jgi:hypothetical protein